MDLRIEKTQTAIQEAFLDLRSRKALEKITVKELCEKARINKSTFYAHYQDIYDLSEKMETQVVKSLFSDIPHPERMLENNPEFTQDLLSVFYSPQTAPRIQILFSGSRQWELVRKIQHELKNALYAIDPAYKDHPYMNILLDYTVYGSYFALSENLRYGFAPVIRIVSQANSQLTNKNFKELISQLPL